MQVPQYSSIYEFVEKYLNSLQFFQSECTFMAVSKNVHFFIQNGMPHLIDMENRRRTA